MANYTKSRQSKLNTCFFLLKSTDGMYNIVRTDSVKLFENIVDLPEFVSQFSMLLVFFLCLKINTKK